MSSQALKATVQQSVRMASQVGTRKKCKIVCLLVKPTIDYNLELIIQSFCHQVAEQHGGGFVWRAGVSFQLRTSLFHKLQALFFAINLHSFLSTKIIYLFNVPSII